MNAKDLVYFHRLILISAWISIYIHYKVWDEITYPFSHFNGTAVEVWEGISNVILHFNKKVITHTCLD